MPSRLSARPVRSSVVNPASRSFDANDIAPGSDHDIKTAHRCCVNLWPQLSSHRRAPRSPAPPRGFSKRETSLRLAQNQKILRRQDVSVFSGAIRIRSYSFRPEYHALILARSQTRRSLAREDARSTLAPPPLSSFLFSRGEFQKMVWAAGLGNGSLLLRIGSYGKK